jgi:hypothetical protein
MRARLPWVLTLLAFGLVVATAAFPGSDTQGSGSSTVLGLLFLTVPVSFTTVGCLLAMRRPDNPVGWLCLVIGLLWSVEALGYGLAGWLGDHHRLRAAGWVGIVGTAWLPAVGLTATHLALRLPNGSFLSPRWRTFSRVCTAMIVIVAVLAATQPGRSADVLGTRNPIASHALESLSPLWLLLPLCVLASIGSLVLRYRRAGGTERLQMRWIAFGGVGVLAAVVTAIVPATVGLVSENSASKVVEGLFYVAFAAIPAAIAVAVLRYRLYDLEVIVNRALVYGALTATLAGTYLGAVLLLQLVLNGVTGDSGLAVAASTLAVAALFRPARAHIQATVDRRFYRRKYNAQRTLDAFSARLRDELALDALSAELRGIVAETMQPAHVSLWLRREERAR